MCRLCRDLCSPLVYFAIKGRARISSPVWCLWSSGFQNKFVIKWLGLSEVQWSPMGTIWTEALNEENEVTQQVLQETQDPASPETMSLPQVPAAIFPPALALDSPSQEHTVSKRQKFCQKGEFQERTSATVNEFKWSKPSSPQVFPSSSQSHFLTSGLISQASGTQPLDSTQCPPGSPLCTEMAFREVLLSPSF